MPAHSIRQPRLPKHTSCIRLIFVFRLKISINPDRMKMIIGRLFQPVALFNEGFPFVAVLSPFAYGGEDDN
jgi:hypothetical protein